MWLSDGMNKRTIRADRLIQNVALEHAERFPNEPLELRYSIKAAKQRRRPMNPNSHRAPSTLAPLKTRRAAAEEAHLGQLEPPPAENSPEAAFAPLVEPQTPSPATEGLPSDAAPSGEEQAAGVQQSAAALPRSVDPSAGTPTTPVEVPRTRRREAALT